MGRISTSIRVEENLWRQARKYAIDRRITVSELLEKALRNEMRDGEE